MSEGCRGIFHSPVKIFVLSVAFADGADHFADFFFGIFSLVDVYLKLFLSLVAKLTAPAFGIVDYFYEFLIQIS
jgi:hypothetical protein